MRGLLTASVALALSLASGVTVAAEEEPSAAGSFGPAGSLAEAREAHTATLLSDGRVLVVGGLDLVGDEPDVASAEVWDSATASFGPAGSLGEARGAHTATLLSEDPDSQQHTASLMEGMGVDPDATSMAVAGRSQSSDPPYFVFAYRFDEIAADQVPLAFGLDWTSSDWRPAVIAGKAVRVGTKRMLAQDKHIRGRPYVYDLGAIRFVIVTDRRGWAEAVLSVLP